MHDPIYIDQMSLVNAINQELSRQCPDMPFCPSIFNTAIKAANLVVEECAREPVKVREGMSISEWFECDDTGTSSKYMAYVIDGGTTRLPIQGYSYPHDADDFGRCLRMVRALGFEKKVFLMLTTGHEWREIASHWDELVAHYDNENWEELYSFLSGLSNR
ncbi:hypothetical protein CGH11_13015 [Vibrio parahaemolyticus]|uniref:hypothetical protein n=1 Tax=Vibrio TaxID=662 RepID=UPI00111FACC0|nr:hypothetical protein [Vibrio parahaemolyticus]EKO3597260.1 hypothetical protein [Vibrio metschnikovii]NAW55449.1 hypothetical protein [Vibrio sp. V41_P2S12T139]NAW93429.1 hypothetical protein [Vibrio sp. V42_P2S4T144]EKA4077110.1 hypothetical protein [Vibrio parahaemolyticus]EKO3621936.1 hypothetical protein [Vibrio metschnikovii]